VANNAKADEDAIRRDLEKARLNEVNQLKELLDNSRTAKREALEQYEIAKEEVEIAKQRADTLQNTLDAIEHEKAEVRTVLPF
jgi:hypothetical protein